MCRQIDRRFVHSQPISINVEGQNLLPNAPSYKLFCFAKQARLWLETPNMETRASSTKLQIWCCPPLKMRRFPRIKVMIDTQLGAAPAQPPFEYFVDATEIALMLGLDPKTVQKMARNGAIPAYPYGDGIRKTWRFLPSEVHEWMRGRIHSEGHPCRSNRRKPN